MKIYMGICFGSLAVQMVYDKILNYARHIDELYSQNSVEVGFNTNVIIKKNKMICNSHLHNEDSNKKLNCKQIHQEDFISFF